MAGAPPSERGSKNGDPTRAVDPAALASVLDSMVGFVPHNRALGMKFVALDGARVIIALPYDAKLVGNPMTRVLHGGAITALMDATCGLSVYVKLKEPIPVATLDLRIDYLRPATPDEPVHARAECFKLTRNVAFVRCEAFHPASEGDLVAVANGTFIVSPGRSAESQRPRR
ncbi:MAG TPA: PaaI family thioesterase [Polyangiaceae bacterium]|nr:PaaI family thioesterase [Polyangiaceae bacterium]